MDTTVRIELDEPTKAALLQCFRSYPLQAPDALPRDELFKLIVGCFEGLDEGLASNFAQSVVDASETTEDGQVTVSTFVQIMNGISGTGQEGEGDDQAAFYEVIMRNLGADEVDMLRDAFIHMDMDSDGYVSLEEMFHVVRTVVGDDKFGALAEYLQPIFIVADKDRDGRLSLTEFLLSFAEGPGVVPTEVINACVSSIRVRLTDDEIFALQERFRKIDTNGDGYIDPEELLVGLREALGAKIPTPNEATFAQILNVVMALADTDHDGKLSLSEFIRSFQEDQGVLPAVFIDTRAQNAVRKLTADEIQLLKGAFAAIDTNADGFVSHDEMYKALWEALAGQVEDKEQVRDLCDLIMATAEEKGGKVTFGEFAKSFEQQGDVMHVPLAAASERIAKVRPRLAELFEGADYDTLISVFRSIPPSGFVEGEELSAALYNMLASVFTNKPADVLSHLVQLVLSTAEMDTDKRLCIDEFLASFAEGTSAADEPASVPAPDVAEAAPQKSDVEQLVAIAPTPTRLTATGQSQQQQDNGYGGSPIRSDASGCPITDLQLRREFERYDVNKTGFLDREEFKQIYMNMEHFGVEPTSAEIHDLFNRYSRGRNTISYEEFTILMLHRSKM